MRLLFLILLFVTKFTNAQEFTISGKVFDSNANVLAGASVNVESTNLGSSSDVNGEFKISLIKGEYTLSISYTGFQTVRKETNSRYYDLILKFKEKTGCPIIVNTSFNVRGEPIVNTPTDAFNCFMGTELDYLVIGNCILEKSQQDPNLKKDYSKEFDLD